MQSLYVAAGGGLGAVCRYLLSRLPLPETALPLSTFFANLIGCFLIGIFAAKAQTRGWNENLQLFLKTGLCGGLTTFSAFSAETVSMIQKGQYFHALIYVMATVFCGFLSLLIGGQLAK